MTFDSDEVHYGKHDEVQHWICEFSDFPFFAKNPQSCPHCGNDDLPFADGHYRPMPNEVYNVKKILEIEEISNKSDSE